jgi:hypothetical protein
MLAAAMLLRQVLPQLGRLLLLLLLLLLLWSTHTT